ncbi:eotaxin-like isoform X2 [Sebastes umbrosus]|uniref:eotaxin-like isoform X2 n=1 Tax=Sebastes umbrosus TaxID=72105 RepID=UPI00189FAF01|nr:eotaxin-like isoform X2 [Sebastes umbrosus]
MRLSLVLAALLCFTTWMSVGHATPRPVSSCCLGRSDTMVQFKRILNYTIQTDGVCQITAVVFLTKLGKRICSDPNSDWAKRTILKLDEEKKKEKALQEQGQYEEGSTSDITPTVSTTSTSAPQRKGRKGRRRRG